MRCWILCSLQNLALPESLLKLIPPRPPGYGRNREDFRIRTSPAFDALAPAEALREPRQRFSVQSGARGAAALNSTRAVFVSRPRPMCSTKILQGTFYASLRSGYEAEIQRTVNAVVLNDLMALAANERASNQVRAIAELKLDQLKNWAVTQSGSDARSNSAGVSALHRRSNQTLSG
mgnify:CR=1 FL=1